MINKLYGLLSKMKYWLFSGSLHIKILKSNVVEIIQNMYCLLDGRRAALVESPILQEPLIIIQNSHICVICQHKTLHFTSNLLLKHFLMAVIVIY